MAGWDQTILPRSKIFWGQTLGTTRVVGRAHTEFSETAAIRSRLPHASPGAGSEDSRSTRDEKGQATARVRTWIPCLLDLFNPCGGAFARAVHGPQSGVILEIDFKPIVPSEGFTAVQVLAETALPPWRCRSRRAPLLLADAITCLLTAYLPGGRRGGTGQSTWTSFGRPTGTDLFPVWSTRRFPCPFNKSGRHRGAVERSAEYPPCPLGAHWFSVSGSKLSCLVHLGPLPPALRVSGTIGIQRLP